MEKQIKIDTIKLAQHKNWSKNSIYGRDFSKMTQTIDTISESWCDKADKTDIIKLACIGKIQVEITYSEGTSNASLIVYFVFA